MTTYNQTNLLIQKQPLEAVYYLRQTSYRRSKITGSVKAGEKVTRTSDVANNQVQVTTLSGQQGYISIAHTNYRSNPWG